MTPTFTAAFAGFRLGFGLILAIGGQNALVLRQGIRREHVLATVLFCALSDALLIALGVSGFGLISTRVPWLAPALKWGGVAFLTWYGIRAFRSAMGPGGGLTPGQGPAVPLRQTLAMVAAMTWLNPHVWLDTVVLLGSVSSNYAGERMAFALGATTASFLFFFSLGYGARLLAPLFAKPGSWRVLDGIVGLTMLSLALGLAIG
jgi:L-lysine exporter family protein LysE/ArgO